MSQIRLRDYQEASVDSMIEFWAGGGEHGLVVLPTGAGKSVVAAELLYRLWRDHGARPLLLTHVSELVSQNARKLAELHPDAPYGIYHAGLRRRDADAPICFAGIHSVFRQPEVLGERHVVLIDEAHLLSHKDEGMYRGFLNNLAARVPGMRVGGLTGTPFRLTTGRLDQDYGKYEALFSKIVYEEPITRLIERGYLVPIVPYVSPQRLDISEVRSSAGDYNKRQLQEAVDKEDINARIVQEIVEAGKNRCTWLTFASGVDHAHHLTALFRAAGVTAECITEETSERERQRIFDGARRQRIQCLTGMNTMTTGIDLPSVDMIACVRPTKSIGLWCLDGETEILTSRGWRGRGQITEGDCVPSMDLRDYTGKWARVTGVIERPMMGGERWVKHEGQKVNFRVTSTHRMIYRSRGASRDRSNRTDWGYGPAIEMAAHRDNTYLPTCVSIDQPGVPLSDAELYFIGMVLTDGTVTPSQVTISQSERHPEILGRIERCLAECGYKYIKREVGKWASDNIPQRNRRWVYRVSVNTPRVGAGSQTYKPLASRSAPGERGCRNLMPYLDKDFSPLLMSMSRAQFLVFLAALHDGDGFKTQKCPSVDYTVRSWTICSARKGFADALQALAVTNGFTSSIRREPRGQNAIYIITITPTDRRTVKGCNVVVSEATDEIVWCIETETGTIITRRKGRVVVMGNCQMLGRGVRLSPETGKQDCLLLDFTDNGINHGNIDEISGSKAAPGAKGEVPRRDCPSCHFVHHISLKACPQCGHDYPAGEIKYFAQSRAVSVLSTYKQPTFFDVDQINFRRHVSFGKPDSLRIDYLCGMKTFSHWLALDNPKGKQLAQRWWKNNSRSGVPPETVDEALTRTDDLRVPGRVLVSKDGKREFISSWDYSVAALPPIVETAL